MSRHSFYRINQPLEGKASFAHIKSFAKEMGEDLKEFLLAVERHGAAELDPAKSLRAQADPLFTLRGKMEGRLSLPSGPKEEIRHALVQAAADIRALKRAVLEALAPQNAPAAATAPYPLAQRAWDAYDAGYLEAGSPPWASRGRLQALLARAKDPWAIYDLAFVVFPGEETSFFSLGAEFHPLLRHSPLSFFGGKTIFATLSEQRPRIREEIQTGWRDLLSFSYPDLIWRLSDPAQKKQARNEIENMWRRLVDESWGRTPGSGGRHLRDVWGLWEAARSAIDHPDAAFRRLGLAVLSRVETSFIADDLREEIQEMILKGLRDPDGQVRYKFVRIAYYFPWVRETLHPGSEKAFEAALVAQSKGIPRRSPIQGSHAMALRNLRKMRARRESFSRLPDFPVPALLGEGPSEPAGRVPTGSPPRKIRARDALQSAQQIVYDLWEEPDPRRRLKMAHLALATSPDCADAYTVLAEEDSETFEESVMWYEKAVAAGERALGKKFLAANCGDLWGYLEARPYMRALQGQAHTLWAMGQRDAAVEKAREMLRLNTGDNQGMRYTLLAWLGALGRWADIRAFMSEPGRGDDPAAQWHYTDALVRFAAEGPSPAADAALQTALRKNPHVSVYLTGRKPPPRQFPEYLQIGSEEEAQVLASDFREAWSRVPGALAWLADRGGGLAYKAGRNDPCPCGSGNKFKKCHGR